MGGEYLIRLAESADTEAVITLLVKCGLQTEGVAEGLGSGYCVAEHSGSVIGVCGAEVYGKDVLLRSLAVLPLNRGMGIGADLIRDRISWAQLQGLCNIYLITIDAAGYFERFGFRAIDRSQVSTDIQRSQEFSVACPSTAFVMFRAYLVEPASDSFDMEEQK